MIRSGANSDSRAACASVKAASSRPVMTVRLPSARNARAVARPIPRDEPATSVTRSSRWRSTLRPGRQTFTDELAILSSPGDFVAGGSTRDLKHEVPAVVNVPEASEQGIKISVAGLEGDRATAMQPILDVDASDAIPVCREFLSGAIAERGTVS